MLLFQTRIAARFSINIRPLRTFFLFWTEANFRTHNQKKNKLKESHFEGKKLFFFMEGLNEIKMIIK